MLNVNVFVKIDIECDDENIFDKNVSKTFAKDFFEIKMSKTFVEDFFESFLKTTSFFKSFLLKTRVIIMILKDFCKCASTIKAILFLLIRVQSIRKCWCNLLLKKKSILHFRQRITFCFEIIDAMKYATLSFSSSKSLKNDDTKLTEKNISF